MCTVMSLCTVTAIYICDECCDLHGTLTVKCLYTIIHYGFIHIYWICDIYRRSLYMIYTLDLKIVVLFLRNLHNYTLVF